MSTPKPLIPRRRFIDARPRDEEPRRPRRARCRGERPSSRRADRGASRRPRTDRARGPAARDRRQREERPAAAGRRTVFHPQRRRLVARRSEADAVAHGSALGSRAHGRAAAAASARTRRSAARRRTAATISSTPAAVRAIAARRTARPICLPACRCAMLACCRTCPTAPFSLLKLWNRAEAAGRLFGLVHDGSGSMSARRRHSPKPNGAAHEGRLLHRHRPPLRRRAGRRRAGRIWPRSAGAGRHADPGADPPLGARRCARPFCAPSNGKPTLLPRMAPLGDSTRATGTGRRRR